MAKRFWVARAGRGVMKIEGINGIFDTEVEAIDYRFKQQTTTDAGLSGDVFVIIDTLHLPDMIHRPADVHTS